MKLKFIGEDGSMGLRTGEVYDTRIFIKGECLWVEWKVNLKNELRWFGMIF